MEIAEKIKQIRRLRKQAELAAIEERMHTQPARTDLSEIRHIHDVFVSVANPKNRDNTKIFILLVFFMYSPASFVNSRMCKGGVRRELAKVLGLSKNAISIYFGDAKSLLFTHKGFREETQKIYDVLTQS